MRVFIFQLSAWSPNVCTLANKLAFKILIYPNIFIIIALRWNYVQCNVLLLKIIIAIYKSVLSKDLYEANITHYIK